MADDEVLLTAEEFGRRPDPGYPEDLIRGKIVPGSISGPRHGQVCGHVCYRMGRHADEKDLGHVVNTSGVITKRDPDTVRWADLSFYSYAVCPKDRSLKATYPSHPISSSRFARPMIAGESFL
ncbi:MAG: hypothetical protein ABSE84_14685 [Isosphaeraceae bacterium]|jgi:hypothetical protein